MKRTFAFASLALLMLSVGASAQVTPVPSLMNFQGRLSKKDGTPVPDGFYTVTFRIYDSQTGGNLLWQEQSPSVYARNGVIAILLGNITPLTDSIFNGTVWLEQQVNTDAPLSPRQRVTSVAYAFKANTVPDGSITAAKLAPGVGFSLPFTATVSTANAFNITNNGDHGRAFLGTSLNGDGVAGISTDGAGIYGISTNNRGVVGTSTNGNGIQGQSTTLYGVYGISNSQNTIAAGVYGTSTNARGVFGVSQSGHGVSGQSTTSAGVAGFSQDGNGIEGTTTGSGYAGYFNGRTTFVNGNVGIGTINPQSALDIAGRIVFNGNQRLSIGGRTSNATENEIKIQGQGIAFSLEGNGGGQFVLSNNPGDNKIYVEASNSAENGTASELLFTGYGDTPMPSFVVKSDSSRFTGTVYANDFANASDARYKTNITTYNNALDTILNLRGVTYNWKRDEYKRMNFSDRKQIGFIAQELEKILPELVQTDANGYKSVNYIGVVPVAVEAIKTLNAKVDAQQKQLDDKQHQIDELKSQAKDNAALKARLETLEALVRKLAEPGR